MSYQVHLRLFCQEEFLRRLSLSRHVDNLILKGRLFIFTLSEFESRATIDINFLLKQILVCIDGIGKVVTEIINITSGNDFVTFEISGIEEITPRRKYKGASFKLIGKIKNTKTSFIIDSGIGDVIVLKVEKRKIPTQLDSFTSPEINTYSLESTVAEKFDAIL